MNFDILEVFTRAGKITWKYKILWIFGMLASCGQQGSSGNSGSSSSSLDTNPFSPEMTNQMSNFIEAVETWFDQNLWILYVFILFVLIMIALQVFASLVGTAGLMRGVVHAEKGEEQIYFGELFSESLKYFWRLFGVSFLFAIPVILFLGIAVLIIFVSGESLDNDAVGGVFIFLFISGFCCLIPFLIIAGFYGRQVCLAITIEDIGIFPAFARAWEVFIKNILGLILVAIILFIGSAIIGLLISLPAFIVLVPLMISFMEGNITTWSPFIFSGIFFTCYGVISWFLYGILMTYIESVWSLIYLRVTQPKEPKEENINMPIAA